MSDWPNLIYRYDGSFDGLLCCVFESYAQKETPAEIITPAAPVTLLPAKEIATDRDRAKRVLASVPEKMGPEALDFVRQAFLTCLPQKEMYILRFLQLGYRYGPAVLNRLADASIQPLIKAVNHLKRESHLLKGFLRFSVFNGVLAAEMEPKNCVLPLLAEHFCTRYREERFLIMDRTHGLALVYQPYRYDILAVEELALPAPDAAEQSCRELWRTFYDAIEVPGRHNPRCRMSHMPQRYWKYMTELADALPAQPDRSLTTTPEDFV